MSSFHTIAGEDTKPDVKVEVKVEVKTEIKTEPASQTPSQRTAKPPPEKRQRTGPWLWCRDIPYRYLSVYSLNSSVICLWYSSNTLSYAPQIARQMPLKYFFKCYLRTLLIPLWGSSNVPLIPRVLSRFAEIGYMCFVYASGGTELGWLLSTGKMPFQGYCMNKVLI